MKIVIDKFLERQFDKNFSGTSLYFKRYEYIDNDLIVAHDLDLKGYYTNLFNDRLEEMELDGNTLVDANDPNMNFCKYLIFRNSLNIKQGTVPIDKSIEPYIKTEYKARNENELPVLSRWVELPKDMDLPTANYLVCILYSKEQLILEYKGDLKEFDSIYTEDIDYGCICVLGTEYNYADPMSPITMMRNALGVDEGGNGVKLNKEMYKESVEFWTKNILIKK